jgi:hypothetical protein
VHLADRYWLDQLRPILLDFHWLQTKLDSPDVASDIANYTLVPEDKM